MEKEFNQEEMVKEAVEEAKKAAQQTESGELDEEAVCQEEECSQEEADTQEADAEEAEDTTEAENSESKAKGGFFKKKNKKDKKDEKIEELTDRLTRQMAEFDNYRKRTEKEKSAMYEIGAKSIVEKMLPVVDNFERGLQAIPKDKKEDSYVQGMEMIYKQILTTFEEIGVKPIEAIGQEFNPDLHNAVMHVEDENLGENIIADEFQKGYTYRDTVVRHSMVKVAN